MNQTLLENLRSAVGAAHVLTDGDLSAWEQDWRHIVRGKALAVVRPANAQEVARVVRACADARVSLVPQGGNTGMVMGAVPDTSGQQVVLVTTRMNAVRAIDADNLTITVEAGCVLQHLQEAAAAKGLLFPLSLAAEGSCTIGGNLATNAGGTQVLRYGNTRDLCLGLEVVTAQGEIWDGLSGLRKDNTGYALRDLFIGSEGTLGVITAATLKLYPAPAATLTAWVALPSLDDALALLNLARHQLGASLTGFEVMGQFALSLVARHMPQQRVPFVEQAPYCALIESSDTESEDHARAGFMRLLETAMESGCVRDAIVAENLAQAHALWHIRESLPMAQQCEGNNIKHDISVPVSRIPAFCASTDAALVAAVPGIRLVNFGHLGDGNLHYNVQAPADGPYAQDAAGFVRDHEVLINGIVFDAVIAAGGSISAEHGIGSLKVHKLPHYKSPVALALMRQVKQALDPLGILNPGRVLEQA